MERDAWRGLIGGYASLWGLSPLTSTSAEAAAGAVRVEGKRLFRGYGVCGFGACCGALAGMRGWSGNPGWTLPELARGMEGAMNAPAGRGQSSRLVPKVGFGRSRTDAMVKRPSIRSANGQNASRGQNQVVLSRVSPSRVS